MIIIVLLLSTLFFFLSMNFIKRKATRSICISVSLTLLVLSIVSICGNIRNGLFMDEKVSVSNNEVYSVSGKKEIPFIIAQPLGTKNFNYVVVYHSDANSKKNETIKPGLTEDVKVEKKDVQDAVVEVKDTEKVYKNSIAKLFFDLEGKKTSYKQTVRTFIVPKSWEIFTPKQVKVLQEKQAFLESENGKKQTEEKAKEYIKPRVSNEMNQIAEKAKNGDDSALHLMLDEKKLQEKQKELVTKYTKEYKEVLKKELIDEVRKVKG